jgi:hypothetical protein
MFELEAGTSTSGPEAGTRMSEVPVDRHASQLGADRCIPVGVADSRLQVVEERSIEQPHSTYTRSGVSGRRSMTSLLVQRARWDRRINLT